MSKVISFEKGYMTSGVLPYVLANLDCGHIGSVTLKPSEGQCLKCNTIQPLSDMGTTCNCGSTSFTVTFYPNHHNEAHYLTAVGDTVECETCASIARDIQWLKDLDVSTIHHSRLRHGSYYFYKLDQTSPSNFMAVGGVRACPEVDAVLTQKRLSPLSPTERA